MCTDGNRLRVALLMAAMLLLHATPACVGYAPGVELSVALRAPRPAIGNGVEHAALRIEGVELVPCPTSLAASARRWFAAPVAYAHGADVSSAMIDLRHTPYAELDRLLPAPGEYCALIVHVTEAELAMRDEVAMTLGQEADLELVLAEPVLLAGPDSAQLTIRVDLARWSVRHELHDAFAIELDEFSR